MSGRRSPPMRRPTPLAFRWPLFATLLLAAILIGWTGFIASDDALYYRGAAHWLSHPPFAGDDHWSTRLPLILSFAGWLAILGRSLAAFGATALSWYAALVLVFGLFARSVGGARMGWIAALLAGTMPVIVANATTVSCDLPEACFLVGGAWALGGSDATRRGLLRATSGGMLFGLAILCRETSLLSLAALAPLFLIGRPLDRRAILAAGIGVALVLGGEALFEWALTGNPLHRYTLAYHHDEHIDRAANLEGNLLVHPAIDPLLVLLVNDDFALIFWVAILAVSCGATRKLEPGPRRRLVLFGALALADFLLVSVLTHKLVLNPRYFLLPALIAVILAALWIETLKPIARAGTIALIVATNLLMLSVENAHTALGGRGSGGGGADPSARDDRRGSDDAVARRSATGICGTAQCERSDEPGSAAAGRCWRCRSTHDHRALSVAADEAGCGADRAPAPLTGSHPDRPAAVHAESRDGAGPLILPCKGRWQRAPLTEGYRRWARRTWA